MDAAVCWFWFCWLMVRGMLVEHAVAFGGCDFDDVFGEDCCSAEAALVVEQDGNGLWARGAADDARAIVDFVPVFTCSWVAVAEVESRVFGAGMLENADYLSRCAFRIVDVAFKRLELDGFFAHADSPVVCCCRFVVRFVVYAVGCRFSRVFTVAPVFAG